MFEFARAISNSVRFPPFKQKPNSQTYNCTESNNPKRNPHTTATWHVCNADVPGFAIRELDRTSKASNALVRQGGPNGDNRVQLRCYKNVERRP
jgi:hypothetical protein